MSVAADRYDMLVAMDGAVHDEILAMFSEELNASWDDEEDRAFYRQKVCTLSDFFSYASDRCAAENYRTGKLGLTATLR